MLLTSPRTAFFVSKIQEFEGQLKVQFDKELAEMQQPVAEAEVG